MTFLSMLISNNIYKERIANKKANCTEVILTKRPTIVFERKVII